MNNKIVVPANTGATKIPRETLAVLREKIKDADRRKPDGVERSACRNRGGTVRFMPAAATRQLGEAPGCCKSLWPRNEHDSPKYGVALAGSEPYLAPLHYSRVICASSPTHPAQGGPIVLRDLKFTHLTTNDGLSRGYVVAILQDRRGFMWFATRDGLNRYDGNAFVVDKNNPKDSGSLSSNFLQDLMQDDHGYPWIATNTGMNKFDPESERCTATFMIPTIPILWVAP